MENQNQKDPPSNQGSEGTGEDPQDLQAGSEGESQKWVLWEQFKKEMLEEKSHRRETKQKKFPQGAVSARVLAEAVCGDDTPALPPSFHQDAEACRRSRIVSVVRHTRDLEKQTLLPADARLLIREPGPQTCSPAVGLAEASLMRQLECQRQKHQVALEEALPGSPAVEEASESVPSLGGCRTARESTVLAGTDAGDLQQSENWGDPSGRSSEQTEQEEQKENLWNQEGPERQVEKYKTVKRAEKTTAENQTQRGENKQLEAQLTTHTEGKPNKDLENVCQSKTLSGDKLHHGEERPYKCLVCGKNFCQKQILTIHLRSHTGEKPFTCSDCDKSFCHQQSLIDHKVIHTGERPYECSYCDRRFSYRSTLYYHKRIHTGDRPYKCSYCDKSFRQKAHFDAHERIHIGDRPFKCPQCEKTFTQKIHLTKHETTHTVEESYQCSHCGESFPNKSDLLLHQRTHKEKKP
ncbi:zinc finger protein 135-like [Hemicordylus capensis]|uniref:zinc finger protein 135-like n=1 Tax=Hemicordylus capensis TaxID=884348 RepID=UPI00230493CD|nr:zinc finger protein 135-like [Hemicordylus capensis]XP_053151729.1 zinc finger protein 135-like [Hemicordylus capensis]XP_053151730.1 zinc finger protein 135-like [Hemicordylus capensis]XP_053151731.1 zinc finger protein 135-like [Hemicordylus capensis]